MRISRPLSLLVPAALMLSGSVPAAGAAGASCMINQDALGTLTVGEPSTVGGKKANVLVDAGDKPGSAPGKLFIAAEGPRSRSVRSKPARPSRGARTGRAAPSTSADVRFSRFNKKFAIKAMEA